MQDHPQENHLCSGCGLALYSAKDCFAHPILKTPQCEPCYRDHHKLVDLSKTRGGVDPNGVDNYCRWCLDGGDLNLCGDKHCNFGFCSACILRNAGQGILDKVQSGSSKWYCFICNPTQTRKPQPTKRIIKKFGSLNNLLSSKISDCAPIVVEVPSISPDLDEDQPATQSDENVVQPAQSDASFDLDKELFLSDDESESLEFHPAMDMPNDDNDDVIGPEGKDADKYIEEMALQDSEFLYKRLRDFGIAMNSMVHSYNAKEFKSSRRNLLSWVASVSAILAPAKHIDSRCQHLMDLLEDE